MRSQVELVLLRLCSLLAAFEDLFARRVYKTANIRICPRTQEIPSLINENVKVVDVSRIRAGTVHIQYVTQHRGDASVASTCQTCQTGKTP